MGLLSVSIVHPIVHPIVRPLIVSFSLPAARVPEGAAQWSKIDHRFPANLKPTGRTGPGTTVGTTRRP